MGNPLQYRDGLSFTWENGRQLHSITQNNTELVMSYDCNGLRTQKGNVHYYYDSSNNLIAMVKDGNTLFFYYDENGSATSFSLGGAMYFYVKNLQGDIINIANSNGTVLVRYDYDVFGKIVSVTDNSDPTITGVQNFALINPLRYRGYVFDDETGLYYLQSRYYDAVTGRFINADVYVDTDTGSPLSTNMFAYCENNANNRADYSGEWFYTLSDYARYRDDRYRVYKQFDANSYKNNWYRQMSITYGFEYAVANNRYKFIKEHYSTNCKKEPYNLSYIFGQEQEPYKSMIFGAGTVGSNGCGSVALYNVFVRINHQLSLSNIILQLELNDCMSNNGGSGTKNSQYRYFLNAYSNFLSYTEYQKGRIDSVKSAMINANKYGAVVGLFLLKNNAGNHAFCIVKPYVGKNGKSNQTLYALNYYNKDSYWIELKKDTYMYNHITKQQELISEDKIWNELRKNMICCFLIYPK